MKTMNVPSYFYLHRKKWKVEIVPHEELECERKTYGVCDPNTRTILLWEKQRPRQMLDSFIHEYIHAIEFEYEIKIKHLHVYRISQRLTSVVIALIRLNQQPRRRHVEVGRAPRAVRAQGRIRGGSARVRGDGGPARKAR